MPAFNKVYGSSKNLQLRDSAGGPKRCINFDKIAFCTERNP